jgi:hypothetical protein
MEAFVVVIETDQQTETLYAWVDHRDFVST